VLGKRIEALRASKKNGNRWPQEVGGWEDPPEFTRYLPETWEVRDSQDSKRGALQ